MRALWIGSFFALSCASCASSTSPSVLTARPRVDPERLSVAEDRADGVGVFTSRPWTFDTNLYYLEGPTGVVVIDTLFLPRDAEEAIAQIAARTHKPIALAIVLHPNPDKFNGADVFRAHGARVVTSAQVLAQIPAVAEKRRRAFLTRYAPDYPDHDPVLASFGDATTLTAGGLEIRVHVLGRGCSEAHVVAEWNGHVFPGDLIASGTHAWLELGYVPEWLERLDELDAMHPRRVHPGRGPSGGPELVSTQRTYLHRVLELVRAEDPRMPPPEGAIERVKRGLIEAYPGYDYRVFLYGLSEVWRRESER